MCPDTEMSGLTAEPSPPIASTDIKVLEPNKKGRDYVIGDLHGNRKVLNASLKNVGPNDRLFLVGDLTDRGEDNPGVIKTIMRTNAKYPGKIQVIQGNHEALTVNCINGLEKIAGSLKGKTEEEFKAWMKELKVTDFDEVEEKFGVGASDVKLHLKNGGEWVLKLFWKELNREGERNRITLGENGEVIYHERSKVKMVHKFMSELPYIIHVRGDMTIVPFNTVHADMPLSDKELQRRIATGEGLTGDEKTYATWARASGTAPNEALEDKGRTAVSVPTYVGHSIVAEGKAPAVRKETNTIDLDVASYKNHVAAFYCATDGTIKYVGQGVDSARENPILTNVENELRAKGEEQQILRNMYIQLKSCTSAEEAKSILLAAVSAIDQKESLTNKLSYAQLVLFSLNTSAITANIATELAKLDFVETIKNHNTGTAAKPITGRELFNIAQKWAPIIGQPASLLVEHAYAKGDISIRQKRQHDWVFADANTNKNNTDKFKASFYAITEKEKENVRPDHQEIPVSKRQKV